MDAEKIDELVESESERLLECISRWDGLHDHLNELKRLLEQYGPELIPHLPWERQSLIESAFVSAWININVNQAHSDPDFDLLISSLAEKIQGDVRFAAIALRLWGKRVQAMVQTLAQNLEPTHTGSISKKLGLSALYWGLNAWTLWDVLQKAYETGLISQKLAPDFESLANFVGTDASDPLLFFQALVLANSALLVDSEQGGDYVSLVQLFAQISQDCFCPENITQSARQLSKLENQNEIREISFDWQGQSYHFELPYQGDEVDSLALAHELNQSLAAANQPGRYYQTLNGDQVCFVFANQASMRQASEALLLFCDDGIGMAKEHLRLKEILLQALGTN